jgi:predicted Rossmann-fold nucleotide-binding protein
MTSHKLFAPRRVGVCGSSKELPPEAVAFCQAVGSELAKNDNIVIVSGGSRARSASAPDDLAADWHIVSAAEREIRERSGYDAIEERIETVITGLNDPGAAEWFQIGKLCRTRGKTREARRFSFVRSLDGLLAVAGRGGTAQEMSLAMELETPVLPVPLFGGSAAEFWHFYEADLIRILRIDHAIAERWSSPAPDKSSSTSQLAAEMVSALLAALQRRCFVIMPYSEEYVSLYEFVIEPALTSVGHSSIRLDRTAIPGDTGRQIQEGIRRCDYAIAVLDGLKANVLYELGLAHAYGKRTILMNREGSFGESGTPFDLALQQRLEYRTLETSLVERLRKAIANLPAG